MTLSGDYCMPVFQAPLSTLNGYKYFESLQVKICARISMETLSKYKRIIAVRFNRDKTNYISNTFAVI